MKEKTIRINLDVPEIKENRRLLDEKELHCSCRPEKNGVTVWVTYRFGKRIKKNMCELYK